MKNLEYKNFKYHDSYGILEPSNEIFNGFPVLKNTLCQTEKQLHDEASERFPLHRHNYYIYLAVNHHRIAKIANLMHQTENTIAMKMLKIYDDGSSHHYSEIHAKMFSNKQYGHDIDCWQSLKDRKLIELTYKGPYGKQFFKITDLGKEILKITSINNTFYRIFRWFKIDDSNEAIEHMIEADLRGECSWRDQEPEVIIEFLEAVFNPNSEMHKLGSCYKWMNAFMKTLATRQKFYEIVKNPKILDWFECHKLQYPGIEIILKKLNSKSLKKKFALMN